MIGNDNKILKDRVQRKIYLQILYYCIEEENIRKSNDKSPSSGSASTKLLKESLLINMKDSKSPRREKLDQFMISRWLR